MCEEGVDPFCERRSRRDQRGSFVSELTAGDVVLFGDVQREKAQFKRFAEAGGEEIGTGACRVGYPALRAGGWWFR